MVDLIIEKTNITLSVNLKKNGVFSFEGKSYPEDVLDFYNPIIDWINKYFDGNEQKDTIVDFRIIYFNSGSSKILFDIFDIFDKNSTKSNIVINWIYLKEDDSSLEDGEDFQDNFPDLKINLVTA